MKCTLPFEPCSSICISGQTGSGKTRWVYQLLTHILDMYAKDPPTRILYCYGIYQPLFDEMERNVPNFTSKQGLPSSEEIDEFTADRCHKLIVIDDLMHKVTQDKEFGIVVYSRDASQMCQCHSDYPKFIPRRKTRQDHRFKYVVHGIDEKFERYFASGYTGSSAISR